MATGIPLPGQPGDALLKGIDTGSGMFSRIMNPIIQRENMQREWKQHLDNLAIQQQAQSRLAQMLPYQIQALKDAHAKADPNYEINQYKALEDWVRGQSGGQSGSTGGLDMDLLKQNPMLRGWAKKHLGFDPLTETPEEKRKAEELSKANQAQTTLDIKKKNALEEEIPQAEKLINDIEDAKKAIEANKKLFGPGVGGLNFLGGPSQRKRGLKTKEEREAWGKIEDLFGELVGKKAADYSHKGLKVAFDLAATTKPSFEEWPETALAKLNKMQKALKEGHSRDLEWYKQHGGTIKNSSKRLKFNPVTGRLE